jgi:thiamine biosynthesis lipoprotein
VSEGKIGPAGPGGCSRRDVLRIGAVVGLGAAFGGALGVDLMRRAGMRRVRQTRTRMGTVVSITVVHPDGDGARALVESAFAEMARLEAALTRHRPEAPLGRLNREGRIDHAPVELHFVLNDALALAERTAGAFDPTVLPVLEAWEATWWRGAGRPTDREIDGARALVGYRGLRAAGEGWVLDDSRMGVTLDGIAKGYIVDRALDVLVAGGADRVLVNAGGDMASAGGADDSEPWTVAIQDPRDAERSAGLVRLDGGCIATSGDYQRSFTEDRRDHHILDPRTGRSPGAVSSVSVIAPTAMQADGLSTALLVLGPDEGRALIDLTPAAGALVVGKDGSVARSRRFELLGA